MRDRYLVSRFIASWEESPFGRDFGLAWEATQAAPEAIRRQIAQLSDDYVVEDDVAIHRTATVEANAVLKGPIIVCAQAFVAANCYLRGGVFLGERTIVGPSCELKTVLMMQGSKIAHLSFVGDSVVGEDVNIEAGAMIANYRNEWAGQPIAFSFEDAVVEPGVDKFGALVGDHTRIGANAVIAPGAILPQGTKVGRLELVDFGRGQGMG